VNEQKISITHLQNDNRIKDEKIAELNNEIENQSNIFIESEFKKKELSEKILEFQEEKEMIIKLVDDLT